MHGRDSYGWLASCLSVAKLPYRDAQDGISYTVSVAPQKAHLSEEELTAAAAKALDMYFDQGGFHMNLNVIDKKTLEDAMRSIQTNIRTSQSVCPATPSTSSDFYTRAAAGCDQPHLPRPGLREGMRCLKPETLEAGSRHASCGFPPGVPDEHHLRYEAMKGCTACG